MPHAVASFTAYDVHGQTDRQQHKHNARGQTNWLAIEITMDTLALLTHNNNNNGKRQKTNPANTRFGGPRAAIVRSELL